MAKKQATKAKPTRLRGHVPVRVARQAYTYVPGTVEEALKRGAVEMGKPTETVASLLAASRAAHARYRQLDTQTPGQMSPAMREAVREAHRLREAAHALDPTFTDPAWAEDATVQHGVPSGQMIVFYSRYLTPQQAFTAKL